MKAKWWNSRCGTAGRTSASKTVRSAATSCFMVGLLSASALATAAAAAAPDTIFYGGKVLTVDSAFTVRQAFAIRGGAFVAVGTNANVRRLAGPHTQSIDLKGSTVIPGLTDSHDHLLAIGRTRLGMDLVPFTSKEEIVAHLAERLKSARPDEVISGSIRWRVAITKQDIDGLSSTNPIVLFRMRRGDALMNSVALQKVGINREHPGFMGLAAPVDAAGEPTGEMPPSPAGLYATALLLPLTSADEEQIVLRGQRQRNALGITSIRDLANQPAWVSMYEHAREKGLLTVRVDVAISTPGWLDEPAIAARAPATTHKTGDEWLRIDMIGEAPEPGKDNAERWTAYARAVNRLGWRMAPHVPPDGIETTLKAFEAANADSSIREKRWVVEHVNDIVPDQMDRFAKLGVIVSTQAYVSPFRALKPEEAARWWPVRELVAHGLTVISGSDTLGDAGVGVFPSNNPFLAMYCYVTGRQQDGQLAPQETVSRADALRFATINGAHAMFNDAFTGSIEPGKLADFVVLSADYLTVPDDEIPNIKAMATYVGGKRVFTRARSEISLNPGGPYDQ